MLSETDAPQETGREWLERAPFTLALGAGFFGFFAHTGVLAALEEAGLRPARIVGVSAGALAGGLYAAGIAARPLTELLLSIRKADFWDPGFPLGGLLKGRKFDALLRAALVKRAIDSIEDCPIPLTLVAARPLTRRAVLLERGPITSAIRASCAVPFLFRPVRVDGRLLVDGGLADRSGLMAVDSSERVLHHQLPNRRPARDESKTLSTEDRRVLTVPAIPAVDPDRLDAAPAALATAKAATERWLNGPQRA